MSDRLLKIEGTEVNDVLHPDNRVTLVDDTVSIGTSTTNTAYGIRDEGARISKCISIFTLRNACISKVTTRYAGGKKAKPLETVKLVLVAHLLNSQEIARPWPIAKCAIGLKGASATLSSKPGGSAPGVYLNIFDRFARLKYKFGNRHFWAKGYYMSTEELNEASVRKYIREQENADQIIDKVSVKELEDPFRGG